MPTAPVSSRPKCASEIWAARRKLPVIPTFSKKLNTIFGGGMRSTGVYVLTGAPGSNKSGTAIEMASAAIDQGYPVIYVSAELTPQLVMGRYLGKKLGMGWLETLDTEDKEKIKQTEDYANKLGSDLWILDSNESRDYSNWIRKIHNSFIEAKAAAYKNETGSDIPDEIRHVQILVIIDYIQDLAATKIDQYENPRTATAALSREIRSLATELFIPILVVSSSSRSFYTNKDDQKDENLMASAKESGEIEYDSAAVFHIRRRDSGEQKAVEIVVAKNRFGEAGKCVVFKFDPVTGAMEETDDNAEALKFKTILDEIGKLIYQNPGKFKSVGTIARELKLKIADVKGAMAVYETGTYQGLKIQFLNGAYYLQGLSN